MTDHAGPAVAVDDLVVRYGERTAVDGLGLSVERGSVTAILGPNGAGKTTAVEVCEGLRRPTAGSVRVLGLDPQTQHARLAPRVGVMLQNGGAWSGVRAEELLRYVASLHAHPLPVSQLVELLGLGSCGRTPYRRLSGGQQQRLALAAAVIGRPELVFLDEPTSGLDPQARRAAWDLVERLRADGVTVVLTTHYLEEAEQLATQVYVIDHGRVIAQGAPADLTASRSRNSIRFEAKPGLDVASLAATLPDDHAVTEVEPGVYRVVGQLTPHTLSAVAEWLARLGILPDALAVERRTLEDVFLELTGRELRT
ncbi:MAG TPA: ABC transporter ATP-binding protein [Nocardioidaceae bacterium]|nr:ABC transporter ATP-binding protein [Nocardioidaceae bacterium]